MPGRNGTTDAIRHFKDGQQADGGFGNAFVFDRYVAAGAGAKLSLPARV